MAVFASIFFGSYLLEDVALAAAIVAVSAQKISLPMGFAAAFLGIASGDFLIYCVGFAARRVDRVKKWAEAFGLKIDTRDRTRAMGTAIFISRVLPGTRTLTYFAAGIVGYSARNFLVLTVVSVGLWVGASFFLGSYAATLTQQWYISLPIVLTLLYFFRELVEVFKYPRPIRVYLHSYRRWLHFEFWPALLFYLPIGPIYIYLSFKHGSPLMPFYVNPNLKHGGLIGESKWEFLKHLDPSDSSTLKAFRVEHGSTVADILQRAAAVQITFPMIVKPDVGQRGFAVRVIRDADQLQEYISQVDFDVIVQQLSKYPNEAGILYVREPSSDVGSIFSITDKVFPSVTGDGKTILADLILKDRRARLLASTYFDRLKDQLENVIKTGDIVPLSFCGNHCQGTIFRNGQELISQPILSALEAVAKKIPDFYFGRFDIRFLDHDSLKAGQNFEIVEVNGAGSEATHIWDDRTRLLDAYKTLYAQWSLVFSIGAQMKASGKATPVKLISFLKESGHVYFRKHALARSS